eukprot:CAMPEP_0184857016 /NCGR_PEP_ID=MMETSP0580-20130426/2188_1 /TAXON_ID=1118495 /ORGANISM="Dactyliosolen fragilissimus" /LENGTH=347 /DNA_ID=CAMNT_0027352371 /DNA_START=479 /DNA_END=1519 /DNA_ORIENTATION=-
MNTNGDAIVSQSEPNIPTTLGIIKYDQLVSIDVDEGKYISSQRFPMLSSISASSFSNPTTIIEPRFTYHLLNVRSSNPTDGVDVPIQGILLLPKDSNGIKNDDQKCPMIVVPHGGPHSCLSTSFVPSHAFLCNSGYAILLANYRGSTGFSQDAIEGLTGNIGRLDVEDVVLLTKTALQIYADRSSSDNFSQIILDPNRVGICGGSHGGFLSAHCIGQHPDLFKASAMRNPVTNIATMVTATDIPDWCHVESKTSESYNFNSFHSPSRNEMLTMWDASPIAHVDKVVAPTLMAVGMKDKRVPPSQGIEFFHTLRSMGLKTKLLVYDDDDHAIDKVCSEADHWVNVKRW